LRRRSRRIFLQQRGPIIVRLRSRRLIVFRSLRRIRSGRRRGSALCRCVLRGSNAREKQASRHAQANDAQPHQNRIAQSREMPRPAHCRPRLVAERARPAITLDSLQRSYNRSQLTRPLRPSQSRQKPPPFCEPKDGAPTFIASASRTLNPTITKRGAENS
jgi:hypothetical protein